MEPIFQQACCLKTVFCVDSVAWPLLSFALFLFFFAAFLFWNLALLHLRLKARQLPFISDAAMGRRVNKADVLCQRSFRSWRRRRHKGSLVVLEESVGMTSHPIGKRAQTRQQKWQRQLGLRTSASAWRQIRWRHMMDSWGGCRPSRGR